MAVLGPSKLSGLMDVAGLTSHVLTGVLEAAGIPFAWDPYPPEEMPSFRAGYGAVDRLFSLLVPAEHLEEARALLNTPPGSASVIGLPIELPRSEASKRTRRKGFLILFVVFIGLDVVFALVYGILHTLGLR